MNSRVADWLLDHMLWIIAALLVAILAVALYIAIRYPCRGNQVFSHYQPMVIQAGKVTTVTMVPIYECVGV